MKKKIIQLNITDIYVEDLFGIYTYSIPMEKMNISKLLILYGNNGAGKTNILQMIFNLLSYQKADGHKTELANTTFKKLEISLSNGYKVSAYREYNLIGDYKLSVTDNSIELIDVFCNTLKEHKHFIVPGGKEKNNEVDDFLDILKEMNLSIHFLSDDRKVKSNISMILDETTDKVSISRLPLDILRKMETGRIQESFSLSDAFLEVAIQRVESWFKHQTLVANSIGQDSLNSIYLELIENLLEDTTEILPVDDENNIKKSVLALLENLKVRNEDFIKYKLSRNLNLDKLINVINKTKLSKIKLIENTITPYINGINEKLNAIEETKNIINVFITTLNDFYHGKKLSFNVEDGLKINSEYNDNEILEAIMLSSGEKQLLLLFCNTITAREHASIFIIDEPELSLNVQWQRKLINALLSFAEGSSIQFILASHSIELLTQYDENVCDLINIKEF